LVNDERRELSAGGSPTFAPSTIAEDVVRAVLRRWPIVLAAALATMLLAWLLASLQPKRYRASSIAAVVPMVDRLETTDVLRGVDMLDRRVVIATVAALASAPDTQRRAIAGAPGSYDIEASVVPNTSLFNVDVEGTDPKRVAQIANRVPVLLSADTQAMYKLYRVNLVSTAIAPSAPSLPRVSRAAIAGLALGVLLGIAAAYLIDRVAATSRGRAPAEPHRT
jgi:capsular polysaccharide biosynthesis protein